MNANLVLSFEQAIPSSVREQSSHSTSKSHSPRGHSPSRERDSYRWVLVVIMTQFNRQSLGRGHRLPVTTQSVSIKSAANSQTPNT